jgi:hypothetical protein
MDERQGCPAVPEVVLPAPKRPWATKVLLQLLVVTQRHLHTCSAAGGIRHVEG